MTIRGKNLYLKKNNKNKKIIISTIIVAILVIIISSYSYALWSATEEQEGFNQVNISCLDLVVNDNKPINLVNSYQLSDHEALEQVPYTFKITNNCSEDEYVSIQLDMKSSNTLLTNNLRLSLISDNDYIVWPSQISELSDSNEINIDGYNTAKKLEIEKIDGNTTKEYNLYLWIDEDTPYEDINNKTFESKIEINNVNEPENSNPTKWHITYDLDGGILTKINRNEYDENDTTFSISNPTKEGYTFAGWSGGKNLLNYNELSTSAVNVGYEVDENGYVYRSTPNGSDDRGWSYDRNNGKVGLSQGDYTLSLNFITIPSSELVSKYGGINFYDFNNNHILAVPIFNMENVTRTFTLSESNNIGIMIKSYEGVYRIQLEEGDIATDWEPYIDKQTSVTIPQGSTGNRTYTANWIPN
ncbi:MAG: InlB B-repeat-containing protein [Bacilli bacterium]|nr:InlB B-repeat-containing protein [Bacilli bacterium]